MIAISNSKEMTEKIAANLRDLRLSLELTQKTLSAQSGVSYAVVKKFESTGKISFDSLMKLAFALNCTSDFEKLFHARTPLNEISLDEILKEKKRKRGRK